MKKIPLLECELEKEGKYEKEIIGTFSGVYHVCFDDACDGFCGNG
jgi:hypothetical protein